MRLKNPQEDSEKIPKFGIYPGDRDETLKDQKKFEREIPKFRIQYVKSYM